MSQIKNRNGMASYLNVGTASKEEYALMGAGFVELIETPTALTTSKRYINEKSPIKRVTGYDWSTTFNTDQIRDEKAVDFICNIGEMQLVGKDAETDYVIVDLDKAATGENSFEARKFHVSVAVTDFPNNEAEMACTGSLIGMGDVVAGSFNTTTKVFTPKA